MGDINNLSFVQGGDPKVHRSVTFAEFRQFFIQRPFREESLVWLSSLIDARGEERMWDDGQFAVEP